MSRFDVVGVGLNATDTLILLPHFPAYAGKIAFDEVPSKRGAFFFKLASRATLNFFIFSPLRQIINRQCGPGGSRLSGLHGSIMIYYTDLSPDYKEFKYQFSDDYQKIPGSPGPAPRAHPPTGP